MSTLRSGRQSPAQGGEGGSGGCQRPLHFQSGMLLIRGACAQGKYQSSLQKKPPYPPHPGQHTSMLVSACTTSRLSLSRLTWAGGWRGRKAGVSRPRESEGRWGDQPSWLQNVMGLASGWEKSWLKKRRAKKKAETGTFLGGPGVRAGTNGWTESATSCQDPLPQFSQG